MKNTYSLNHQDKIDVSDPHESAVEARSDIPFELTVADEKFIADAQKYTDLSLSELDVCQHKVSIHFPFNLLNHK